MFSSGIYDTAHDQLVHRHLKVACRGSASLLKPPPGPQDPVEFCNGQPTCGEVVGEETAKVQHLPEIEMKHCKHSVGDMVIYCDKRHPI